MAEQTLNVFDDPDVPPWPQRKSGSRFSAAGEGAGGAEGVPHGAERAAKGNEKPTRGEDAANTEGSGADSAGPTGLQALAPMRDAFVSTGDHSAASPAGAATCKRRQRSGSYIILVKP